MAKVPLGMALVALLGPPSVARGGEGPLAVKPQEDAADVIEAVEVVGARTLVPETVRHYLGVEPGQRWDQDARRRSNRGLHELWASGLVDDVEVEVGRAARGVALWVRLSERPRLSGIEVSGLSRLRESELFEHAEQAHLELEIGRPLRLDEAHRLVRLAEELLRADGHTGANARSRLDGTGIGEARLRLEVDPGPRPRVGEIRFEGNRGISSERLRRAMHDTKASRLWSRVLQKDRIVPDNLDADLGSLARLYRSFGYADVVVGPARVEEAGSGVEGRFRVVVPIDEGERVRLRSVVLEGNREFPAEVLLAAFPPTRDTWLDGPAVDAATTAITDRYASRGFLDVRVGTDLRPVEAGLADLIVTIAEGRRYRVERLEFSGNTHTRDAVLRRELAAREGEVLDLPAFRRSLGRLEQVGYFSLDRERPVDMALDEDEGSVALRVRGTEADKTRFDVGASWNPGVEVAGRFSLETHNLLGRGYSLGLTAEGGGLLDAFDLAFADPWFLGRPQQLGGRLFRRERRFESPNGPDSVQEERGGLVSLQREGGRRGSAYVLFERQETEQRLDVGESPSQGPGSKSAVRLGYRFDTRDDPVAPSSGVHLRASAELAGGPLGGDRSWLEPEVGFSLFHTLHRGGRGSGRSDGRGLFAMLAWNMRAGWIEPSEDGALFPLDGFFLGGPDTVRGFRDRSIFVRNEDGELETEDGFNVGGSKLLQANLELHLELWSPLRLVLFGDAGNVFARHQSLDPGDLRTSAGVELRLALPGLRLPLRLIYSRNLEPLPGDRFESLRITLGTSF